MVGLGLGYLATGVLAVLTCWILLSGMPPLFEAAFVLAVALFGMHWLVISSDVLGFYVGLELANFAGVVCLACASQLWLGSGLALLAAVGFLGGLHVAGVQLVLLAAWCLGLEHAHVGLARHGRRYLVMVMWLVMESWLGSNARLGDCYVAWGVAQCSTLRHHVSRFGVLRVWQPICHGIGWVAMSASWWRSWGVRSALDENLVGV